MSLSIHRTQFCSTCKYYFAVESFKNAGHCRLKPPVIVLPVKRTIVAIAGIFESQWPRVLETDWCGEYK